MIAVETVLGMGGGRPDERQQWKGENPNTLDTL
jgi:hypothetical protein